MGRRDGTGILTAVLFLVMPACGSAGQPSQTGDTSRADASKQRGVALKRVGRFDSPVYVTGAPGCA
jgi:hypothetical protein